MLHLVAPQRWEWLGDAKGCGRVAWLTCDLVLCGAGHRMQQDDMLCTPPACQACAAAQATAHTGAAWLGTTAPSFTAERLVASQAAPACAVLVLLAVMHMATWLQHVAVHG